MQMYQIYYKTTGSDDESRTVPIAGVDEKDALADFKRNALDPFTVTKIVELKKYNIYRTTTSTVCERARVTAESEEEAIKIAEEDTYENEVLDWKEDHNENDGWNFSAKLSPIQ